MAVTPCKIGGVLFLIFSVPFMLAVVLTASDYVRAEILRRQSLALLKDTCPVSSFDVTVNDRINYYMGAWSSQDRRFCGKASPELLDTCPNDKNPRDMHAFCFGHQHYTPSLMVLLDGMTIIQKNHAVYKSDMWLATTAAPSPACTHAYPVMFGDFAFGSWDLDFLLITKSRMIESPMNATSVLFKLNAFRHFRMLPFVLSRDTPVWSDKLDSAVWRGAATGLGWAESEVRLLFNELNARAPPQGRVSSSSKLVSALARCT